MKTLWEDSQNYVAVRTIPWDGIPEASSGSNNSKITRRKQHMKSRYAGMCQVMALTLLACSILSAFAFAQDSSENMKIVGPAHARFAVLPPKPGNGNVPPAVLQTWNGSFTYNGTNYPYNMVGFDPSTNQTATIPTFIIPIKIVIQYQGHQYTFDPTALPTSDTAVAPKSIHDTEVVNTITSPIFDNTTDYVQGGVDLGTTQYEDAFQRGNFWGVVQSNPNTHVLLGFPTVLPTQTLNVPANSGTIGHDFGITAGLVDINYFDAQISAIITHFSQIQPNSLPLFETGNVYLTQGGGCCIGGYHSANGPQAYSHFTYVNHVGAFSQDVSAMSHEIGEFIDDPLVNGFNNVACGILEVGDPLENYANFGAFHYVLHGFTYNLQDLVFLPYFGAPPSTSLLGWFSFQNHHLSVCQNGG
jgi:hypothetical protein